MTSNACARALAPLPLSLMPPAPEAARIDEALRVLGFEQFRTGQREAIETLLSDNKLLLVAPTGGGKSLVYQLPALLLEGTTLVISPLIALMHDQVTALEKRGVRATYLASTLESGEVRERMSNVARGAYRLVYVAPERIGSGAFQAILRSIECPLLAVDEAHCISEWGHDFRPEYLSLDRLVTALPKARVLACTATATPVVRDEIVARLGLGADTPQRVHGFARPNLVLRAAEVSGRRDRDHRVNAQLRESLGVPVSARGTAIVYSPTRKQCEQESERLANEGWRVAPYHAGLAPAQREDVQRRFINGELQVVVATNAFGMGIDRGDVRVVVHLAPPGSIEAYYQEVGRAGRDGETAWGLLLSSTQDLALRRMLIESSANDEATPSEIVEHKWNLFMELMRWTEGGSCRHDAILRYFGDESELLGGCGRCDVCSELDSSASDDAETVSLTVRKALSAVARIHGRYGLQVAAKLLKGAKDERLARSGLDQVKTYGTLSTETEDWIVRLLRRCVTAGWVLFDGSERPVVSITQTGRAVMLGRLPARLILPPRTTSPRRDRPPTSRSARQLGDEDALDAAALRLFEALRAHRLVVSRTEGVPPYVVASDRTLRDIALMRPSSRSELLMAHGIGETKADRYGEGLLQIVRDAQPPA